MIIHAEVEQGTDEWKRLRLGRPTASGYSRIVTPARLQPASGATTYAYELLAERHLNAPLMDGSTDWMQRGTEMEAAARAWYAFETGSEVRQVGFCETDDQTTGGSPDGLIYVDGEPVGGLEIKCRGAAKHMAAIFGDHDTGTMMQIQGSMWVTGLPWWDSLDYCEGMPAVLIRHTPDEAVQAALSEHVPAFCARVAQMWGEFQEAQR